MYTCGYSESCGTQWTEFPPRGFLGNEDILFGYFFSLYVQVCTFSITDLSTLGGSLPELSRVVGRRQLIVPFIKPIIHKKWQFVVNVDGFGVKFQRRHIYWGNIIHIPIIPIMLDSCWHFTPVTIYMMGCLHSFYQMPQLRFSSVDCPISYHTR